MLLVPEEDSSILISFPLGSVSIATELSSDTLTDLIESSGSPWLAIPSSFSWLDIDGSLIKEYREDPGKRGTNKMVQKKKEVNNSALSSI
jgi:hypothetical protein